MLKMLPVLAFALLTCGCAPRTASSERSASDPPTSTAEGASTLQKPSTTQASPLSDEAKALARTNAEFAVSLYQTLRTEPGNMLFSPYSISAALAMTYDGARGETAQEMANVLRFTNDRKQLPPAFANLDRNLRQKSDGFELSIANNLWGQTGFPFEPEFRKTLLDDYGADLKLVDFTSKAGSKQAADAINRWVGVETRDKITKLIHDGDLDSLTRLVLVNAIYSKGLWATEFKSEKTRPGDFFVSPGKAVTTPMMYASNMPIRYAYADDVQVAELPYRGDRASFVILLPSPTSSLEEFERSLTAERLNALLAKLQPTEIDVSLPSLKLKQRAYLADALIKMGMPQAFDEGRANFSGMSKEFLMIDKVIHEATLDVDEKGAVAAAATAVIMQAKSARPSFAANRPFLFLIRDRATGSLLFMGRVVDPTAREGAAS